MDDRCIIFYDSGIGGINLMKRTFLAFPKEDYLYFGDFKNMPYGNKTDEKIRSLVSKNLGGLEKFIPKLIVVACNTASTVAAKAIQGRRVKTVGVYPKVNPTGTTALICTDATARSAYVKKLSEKTKGLTVFSESDLASEIEKAVLSGDRPEIDPLKFKDYDFVSLGCTHYSYIKEKLLIFRPAGTVISGEDDAFCEISSFISAHPHREQNGSVSFLSGNRAALKRIFSSI